MTHQPGVYMPLRALFLVVYVSKFLNGAQASKKFCKLLFCSAISL